MIARNTRSPSGGRVYRNVAGEDSGSDRHAGNDDRKRCLRRPLQMPAVEAKHDQCDREQRHDRQPDEREPEEFWLTIVKIGYGEMRINQSRPRTSSI